MRQLGWRRKKNLPVKTPTRSRFAAPSKPRLSCLFVHFSSVLLKRLKPSCCGFFFFVCAYVCAHVQACALSLAALTSSEGVKDAGDDEEEEDDIFETEFRQYKRTYYMTKIGVEVVSE